MPLLSAPPCPPLRCRAREELKAIFATVIRARRAAGIVEEDVLQQFIDAK